MGTNFIKNLGPNKNSKYKQGIFDNYNPKKYFGPRPIIYRSSYELIFMQKMEFNNNVEKWSSENIQIPYLLKEKINGKIVEKKHTYNIDFTVYTKDGRKYVIEVKPYNLAPLNESQIMRNPDIYKNYQKWKAAIKWCKANGFEFKVVTEKNLGNRIF